MMGGRQAKRGGRRPGDAAPAARRAVRTLAHRLPSPRRPGSVLVLALWTLAFLGFLAVAVGGFVSANVRMAEYVKYEAIASALARAGVERAIAEIMINESNYVGTNVVNNPALFKRNTSLAGGDFSVSYLYFRTNDASIVTNFGFRSESAKIDIDDGSAATVAQLDRLVGAALSAEILSNYPAQKDIAPARLNRYGAYDTLPELLVVDGVDEARFRVLERLATLRQFKFYWLKEGKRQRRGYGGQSTGRALAGGGRDEVAAVREIVFVFDKVTTNLLYWREY